MAILAVCPYCGKGKVRAPNDSEGLSATCPSCKTSFTIVVTSELPRVASSPAEPTPLIQPAPADASPTTVVTESPPTLPSHVPAPPALQAAFATPPPPQAEHSFVIGMALVAITLAGIGLIASQLEYGRIITVAFGVFGLFLGLSSLLLAERKPLIPGLAATINALALILAIFLPSWLGLTTWIPPKTAVDPNAVQAVGLENSIPTLADEWVDISRAAWQREDVRVMVTSINLAPIELTDAKDKKSWTKERWLQIGVRLRNEGVARKIDFRGWDQIPRKDAPAVRLTDPAGHQIAAKIFAPEMTRRGMPQPVGLFPGKSTEQLLVFEPPAGDPAFLRLELPGDAFGDRDPVRLLIPRSLIPRSAP